MENCDFFPKYQPCLSGGVDWCREDVNPKQLLLLEPGRQSHLRLLFSGSAKQFGDGGGGGGVLFSLVVLKIFPTCKKKKKTHLYVVTFTPFKSALLIRNVVFALK